jgi:hypothetical protein
MPLRSGGISHASSGGKISWLGRKPAPAKSRRRLSAPRERRAKRRLVRQRKKRAVQSGSSFDQFRPRHRVHSVANVQALQLGVLGAMRRASSHSSVMGKSLHDTSCNRGQMPGRVTGDPQHWRDRAAQMRALALTMKDPEIIILITDLTADYEKFADWAAAKTAKLP